MSQKRELIRKKSTNLLFVMVSIFSFIMFIVLSQLSIRLNHDNQQRSPASVHKENNLKHFHDKLSVHQKIKPPIEVAIEKKYLDKIHAGEEFEISAIITSSMDTQNVKVEWSLPNFVEVVSGETLHTFEELAANDVKEVRLLLKSHSEENQQIHITASAPYGKQILSSVDQFNTVLEQDLTEAKAALVKRNLDYIEQNQHND